MVFVITIIVAAVIIAVLLNKSKISKIAEQVEDVIAPAIEEVKEVVEKAAEVAPENKVVAEIKQTTDQVKTKAPAAKAPAAKKPVTKTNAKKAK
jgi:Sec-independent protein translocase protein TatA